MKSFEVHAGWLTPPQLIGKCNIERARGKEIISFSYDAAWLSEHPGFNPDPDIICTTGRQYPPSDKRCFGFLADTAPDRWGRMLMDRRERIDSILENRAPVTLMESDYILGVHDAGRIGGIRFFDPQNDIYLSCRDSLAAPPMEKLRELEDSSYNIEDCSDKAAKKWIQNLIEPGSSLGGARPKANVVDENGDIWIAKFSSKSDTLDIGAWEMVAHNLALKCDIAVPEAKFLRLTKRGGTFLSKRFDRCGSKRIHYASAMTLLGQTDGNTSSVCYLDMADIIERISLNPERDLRELWKRIVFFICISNTDDHLRNHGFLLKDDSWVLSPCFDINPSPDKKTLSMAVATDDRLNFTQVLEYSNFFRVSQTEAREIISDMSEMIKKSWKQEAERFEIPSNQQKKMAAAFAKK